MSDEPTLGELSRQIAEQRQDNKDEHVRLRRALAHKISDDRYFADCKLCEARYNQLRADLDDLIEEQKEARKAVEQAKADRAANRKWVIAAVLIPVIIGVVEIYLAIKGVK